MPRYSLRTLLFFILAVCVSLGVVVNRARTQREAVRRIEGHLHGKVMYDYHEVAPRTWSAAGKSMVPVWLRRVLGPEYFDRPAFINMAPPPDESWEQAVDKLSSIKHLLLASVHVDDRSLAGLRHLSDLRELDLVHTEVSDHGLKHLHQFPKLKWLAIQAADMTDAGITQLATLPHLEELSLFRIGISDAAIPHLSRMSNLRVLRIEDTQITDAGAEELRKALPNCKVQWKGT